MNPDQFAETVADEGDDESNVMCADWHGWGTDFWSLHVGHLPGRKSLCLYYQSGRVVDTLAFFRDEQSARAALAVIDRLAHGRQVPNES